MKNITMLLPLMVVLYLLNACTIQRSDSDVQQPSTISTIPATELYTDAQLEEIVRFSGTANELLECYPPHHVVNETDHRRIAYYSDNSVAVIWYNLQSVELVGKVYDASLLKEKFDTLKIGMALSDVQALDPHGEYLFLYTGVNEPRCSTHYTKDRYMITVMYDEDFFITDIYVHMICEKLSEVYRNTEYGTGDSTAS